MAIKRIAVRETTIHLIYSFWLHGRLYKFVFDCSEYCLSTRDIYWFITINIQIVYYIEYFEGVHQMERKGFSMPLQHPDNKNNRDQTYSCPSDKCLSAIMCAQLNFQFFFPKKMFSYILSFLLTHEGLHHGVFGGAEVRCQGVEALSHALESLSIQSRYQKHQHLPTHWKACVAINVVRNTDSVVFHTEYFFMNLVNPN